MKLPVGSVTFLLTDIADSTATWQDGVDEMAAAVGRYYQVLDEVVTAHGGVRPEEQGEGDSTVAAFPRASDAVAAAIVAQLAFQTEAWSTRRPLRIRMGINTGEARLRNESNYAGIVVIAAARLRDLAHGGQILLSAATREEIREPIELRDLGEHRLKDLRRTERVYQALHAELPTEFGPLRSSGRLLADLPARRSLPGDRALVRLLG